MREYISTLKNLSLCILILLIPNFVLASAPTPLEQSIEKRIAQMSLEEKVGQLFIVGFPQKDITKELDKFIRTYKPGSFLLFKRNILSLAQVKKLNADLTRLSYDTSELPPLLAIDQEGGSVSRLPLFPTQPNALALGQTQSPALAEEMGYQTGLFLREVGFNMNLAPVLDVVDPKSRSFIGVRSFGPDPEIVKDVGVAYSRGLLRSRVIPTAKHFPGTGNLALDPHQVIVENAATSVSLRERDLVPYQAYAELGRPVAVMLSHLLYPSLDPSREPASFSKKISTDLLRGEMKYQGLVMTDDLQMQGSKQLLRPEVAALRALKAGADIVMLSWSFADQGKAFNHVKKAVQSGDFAEKDLNDKLRRILYTKAFANNYKRDPAIPSMIAGSVLTSPNYHQLEEQIFSQNLQSSLLVTHLPAKETSARKPASQEVVCTIAPSKDFITSFKAERTRKEPTRLLNGNFDKTEVESWIKSRSCDVVLLAITGPKTAQLAGSLAPKTRSKTLVVNLSTPRWVPNNKGYLKVVQLSFNHMESGKRIAQNLTKLLDETHVTSVDHGE
ncbi:glycoside hydrolase family 3 protein [Bdellovibrio sp. HCB2-146]|uniref:glycoside hydrolase family 3 protein n=1 Tax=Bdellovibrio sp. HCB2-146 TaxID=3394362 RepID=UPI0039BC2E84